MLIVHVPINEDGEILGVFSSMENVEHALTKTFKHVEYIDGSYECRKEGTRYLEQVFVEDWEII